MLPVPRVIQPQKVHLNLTYPDLGLFFFFFFFARYTLIIFRTKFSAHLIWKLICLPFLV